MIPDTRQRLEKALQELQSTLVSPSCGSALHVTLQRSVLRVCNMKRRFLLVRPDLFCRWDFMQGPAFLLQVETAEAAADTEELSQAQEAMRHAQTLLAAAEPP